MLVDRSVKLIVTFAIFSRLDEPIEFRGSKDREFERARENLLKGHSRWFESISLKALDIFDLTWHLDMFKFSEEMMNFEAGIENLAISAFRRASTLEEAIGNLYPFCGYCFRPRLAELFNDCADNVISKNTRVRTFILKLYPVLSFFVSKIS